MVLSGCHSFSDTCSETAALPPPAHVSICLLRVPTRARARATLASGLLSPGTQADFWSPRSPLVSKLPRGDKEGRTMVLYTDFGSW